MTRLGSISQLLDELAPAPVSDEPAWDDILARAELLATSRATNGHVSDPALITGFNRRSVVPGRAHLPLGRRSVVRAALARQKSATRRATIAGLVAAALVATGVAIAAGFNPFAGIGAANHPQRATDVLNSAVAAQIRTHNREAGRQAGRLGLVVLGTSRYVGRASSGTQVFVATTTRNALCVITVMTYRGKLETSIAYVAPLTKAEPTTIGTFDQVVNGPSATPPLSYGVAQNGVIAVSFKAHGKLQTVPVRHNVWFYQGQSSLMRSITVHYADDKTKTLTH
jgi:hypothetical protein